MRLRVFGRQSRPQGLAFPLSLVFILLTSNIAFSTDTTPPQLTAFSVHPTQINTTSAAVRVIIDFTITDSESGFASIEFTFTSPQYPVQGVMISTSAASNGTKSFNGSTGVTFSAGSQPGDWPIEVVMTDVAGNTRILRSADLAALKFSDHVTVLSPSSIGTLSFNPAWLSFNYILSGTTPAAQTILVVSTASGIDFRVEAGTTVGDWLGVSPASGTASASVSVTVDPKGLSAGTYNGKLTFTSTRANNSPQAVAVSLTVSAATAPSITVAAVNGASFKAGIAPGAWISIIGQNLSTSTRTWTAADIVNSVLPTSLAGVSVTINNKPAAIYYVSPTQLNVQAPDDTASGSVSVAVNTPTGMATGSAMLSLFSPGLFTTNGTYAAAVLPDGSVVGNPAVQGAAFKPAHPGDVVMLYGTGFGPTNPTRPAGNVISAAPMTTDFTVSIGGVVANSLYGGIVGAGLYQFNVEIPDLPNGDSPVMIHIDGLDTQTGVMIPIKK